MLWHGHASIFFSFMLTNRVMSIAWPDMNFLSKVLDQFMNGVVMSFRRQSFFRVVRWSSCWSTRVVATVNAALRNAWIEVFYEARIVEATFWVTSIAVFFSLNIPEQWISLCFRSDGDFIVAVVLISSQMRKILMVCFILVNIVEIVRKMCIANWRWMSIQWSTSSALKG